MKKRVDPVSGGGYFQTVDFDLLGLRRPVLQSGHAEENPSPGRTVFFVCTVGRGLERRERHSYFAARFFRVEKGDRKTRVVRLIETELPGIPSSKTCFGPSRFSGFSVIDAVGHLTS